ncbi:hypothetical protein, partial [Lactobacillus sp. UCMA15818]|uniref:hypothetical protein n=1 Tax=Lactobacillus sp. UCMA15818 TaxID=2583394 RepID=UPI0025AEF96F
IAAMNYDKAIRDTRIEVWRRNSQNPGFTAVAALMDDQVVGVAYGFNGSPDHWWNTNYAGDSDNKEARRKRKSISSTTTLRLRKFMFSLASKVTALAES